VVGGIEGLRSRGLGFATEKQRNRVQARSRGAETSRGARGGGRGPWMRWIEARKRRAVAGFDARTPSTAKARTGPELPFERRLRTLPTSAPSYASSTGSSPQTLLLRTLQSSVPLLLCGPSFPSAPLDLSPFEQQTPAHARAPIASRLSTARRLRALTNRDLVSRPALQPRSSISAPSAPFWPLRLGVFAVQPLCFAPPPAPPSDPRKRLPPKTKAGPGARAAGDWKGVCAAPTCRSCAKRSAPSKPLGRAERPR